MKVNKIRMMHLFVSVLFHVSLSWVCLRSIFFSLMQDKVGKWENTNANTS